MVIRKNPLEESLVVPRQGIADEKPVKTGAPGVLSEGMKPGTAAAFLINAPSYPPVFHPSVNVLHLGLVEFESPLDRRRFQNIEDFGGATPASGEADDFQEGIDDLTLIPDGTIGDAEGNPHAVTGG